MTNRSDEAVGNALGDGSCRAIVLRLAEQPSAVVAPIDRAFEVFTAQFGEIMPKEHNLLGAPITATTFEPRVGGHIFATDEDGRWARILAYEPPNRVVSSWDISPHWRLETDEADASEVEVRFLAETAERTRVELVHRNLDRQRPWWEGVRDGVADDAGWPLFLARYAEVVAASS